jgi:hypothetical protein
MLRILSTRSLNTPTDRRASRQSFYRGSVLPNNKRLALLPFMAFAALWTTIDKRERNKSELIRELDILTEGSRCLSHGERNTRCSFSLYLCRPAIRYSAYLSARSLRGVADPISSATHFSRPYLFCYALQGGRLMMNHVLVIKTTVPLCSLKNWAFLQLTNILRDLQEDKNMGQIYLPQEELAQSSLGEQDIVQEKLSDRFIEMMKFQVARANTYYDEANNGIPMLDTDSQFAIYAASKIYRRILD